MDTQEAKKLSVLYRMQLTELMEIWASHSIDSLHGGYLTDFGEDWKLVSDRKNIWAQARQTYMFAAYAAYLGHNPTWLRLAKIGRDFIVQYAYAGNGRWNYEISPDGTKILEGTTTIFTDIFLLLSLSQYASVSGDLQDYNLIFTTFSSITKHLSDPEFKDLQPHRWQPGITRYSPYMIAFNAFTVAETVLGPHVTQPFVRQYLNKMLFSFGQNSSGFLLESLQTNGDVWDTPEGRVVNAGHVFEGMWFCIDYARAHADYDIVRDAVKLIVKTADYAIDSQYGGLIYQFSCDPDQDIQNLRTDMGQVDDKIDWVNCEGLYAFALADAFLNTAQSYERFMALHQFCQKHFRDKDGGDWYPALSRNGTPIRKNKGGKHRVAFHVPRALMNLSVLCEQISKGEGL